ncbi:MAG: hypothetical protein ACOYNN_13015 [Terrimicrobiaceae bacterium]
MQSQVIAGAEVMQISTPLVSTGVTTEGGHLWPAQFRVRDRWIEPLSMAPWNSEKLDKSLPPILRILRGDFFCLPFGGNATALGNEKFPVHGETANRRWKCHPGAPTNLHLSMRTRVRPGRVDKYVHLVPGHPAIYQRHVISGFSGALPVGHHAMLHFAQQKSARISLSRFVHGQVFPGKFENAAEGGYSCLKPGSTFSTLQSVPQIDGRSTDLSVYPSREGFEDLVLMAADTTLPFAWTAVTVASEGWVWVALKDPRVLRSTIFWMSNGGRHYSPWSGRHRGVIGVEEVTANFHSGAAESVRANALSRKGIATAVPFDPNKPTTVNYIMAMGAVPRGFDIVKSIHPLARGAGIEIVSASGKEARIAVDLGFLSGSETPKSR